jgi:hypothetical protein
MKRILSLMFAISVSSLLMAQNTTVYRDNLGRKTGTATKDSRGVTTYRDELGRKTGTSEKKLMAKPSIVMLLAERLVLRLQTGEV